MLKIEMKKLKVTNLLITILVIPLLANIFGLINFMGNRELLTNSWKSLWTQVSLFYFMFFLTPLIAIIVSTLWSVEHKARLKLIRICPIKNIKFIISKAFISFILIAIAQFYFLFLFIIFGKFICGFKEINLNLYIYYIILSILFSIPIIIIMSFVNIKIKSLGISVLISVMISIAGFAMRAQNIFHLLQNIFALSNLGIKMNNFEILNFSEAIKIFVFGILEVTIFLRLSQKSLQYED